jgi:hypothetical protein
MEKSNQNINTVHSMQNSNIDFNTTKNELCKTNSLEENSIDEITLEILSPLDKKDDDRIKKYLKHIKDAIDNDNVKNLALSGVYGSGKSTIIKSFKALYPNAKTLEISLASFNETNEYDKFKDQIQLNILQQIIYSQKADKLPESRINRISEVDIWDYKNWLKVVPFFLLIVSSYLLLNYYSYQLNPNNWNSSDRFNISCIVLVILFLVSIFFVGQFLIEILKNIRINKISLKDAELGNKNDNKDILNKHIDEILYFFEKIPIEIVVIEDLDRFNTTEIYRTLREVNFIINTYLANINSINFKKVTFLYAIKDDLFANELDRTKFFDLIIPAIPFVNYSNSKNVLNTKINEIFRVDKNSKKPSKVFINTVSTFITDNRILLNIINEFIVYREQQKLETEDLNPDKLLALIIYKNLRPKDFSRLLICKSNVDIIFSNKRDLVNASVIEINGEIDKIKVDIKKIKKDNLKSISELNTIFLYHIKEKIEDGSGLIIENKEKTFKQIIEDACDMNYFYNNQMKKFMYAGSFKYDCNISFNDIDKIVGYKYFDKYDLIINKDKLIIEKENEIKLFREQIAEIENWNLAKILKNKDFSDLTIKINLDEYYSESNIDKSERIYNDSLLIFLLINGYLDEHYREYTSIFQKGGLNELDHEFKINILSLINEPKPFEYKLTNIEDIINELPLNYFKDNRILNISIIDYLIDYESVYQEKLHAILKVISERSNRSNQFLNIYIQKSDKKNNFIIELAKSWKELWFYLESDDNFIEEDKRRILNFLLNGADDQTLMNLNKEECLCKYISENINILFEFKSEKQLTRIKDILSSNVLNVKFKNVSILGNKLPKIFDIVYFNDRYQLNSLNIKSILEYKLDNFDSKREGTSNLSYIYECKLDNLINYIEKDNFNSYIDDAYSKLENYQDDNENYVLKVLNNENLDILRKTVFIKKQINPVSDITELKRVELYDLVLTENKIESSWENIYQYYFKNEDTFNLEITNFINDSSYNLYQKIIDLDIEKEKQNKFVLKLISNEKLATTSYENIIVKCISKNFEIPEDFDFKIISQDKVKILIKTNNIIPLTKNNFEEIKSIHPSLHIKLLLRSWNAYLDYCTDYDIDVDDKILILQDDDLQDDLKISIIKDKISVDDLENNDLAIEVVHLILNSSTSNNKSNIITTLKLRTLLNHPLNLENKIKLINLLSDKVTKSDVLEIQKELPEYYRVYPKSQLLLKNNDVNAEYVKILQKHKIAGQTKITKKDEIRIWLNDYTK